MNIFVDLAFDAKFEVLDWVFNKREIDTVEFTAFNHYERPFFENNEYSLLYISSEESFGVSHLQKYQSEEAKMHKKYGWVTVAEGIPTKIAFIKAKNGILKNRGVFK